MDKTKKKSLRRYLFWGAAAVVVLVLALMPLMARQQQMEDEPVASILSDSAKIGSVSSAVHGGGTLEADTPEDVELPKNVKITEFLVKNGDMVKKGDPVAQVDKVSVMTAITQIQDSMSTVEKQMEAARDEKADTTIAATAGGRVKEVYGKAGDRVESVLLEHGALAVLSLDGRMCATIHAESTLATGDSVTVTLEDGTQVTGRVESNLSGELTVTVEDRGYAAGQTVTVGDVGKGTLEIHSPWSATAFTGEISAVYAKPEQTLSSGATLFTLKNTDYTAQQEILASTHRDYEELLQKLFQMYETGVITAPCDGMVSGIDEDSAHLLAVEEENLIARPLTVQAEEFHIVLLGTPACTGGEDCPLPPGDPGHEASCPYACTGAENCPAKHHKEDCLSLCIGADEPGKCPAKKHKSSCIEACIHATEEGTCTATKHYNDCIESCISTDGCQDCPATVHKSTCIDACTHADTTGTCKATLHHYTDCIESCIKSTNPNTPCPASKHKEGCYFSGMTYKAIAAKVIAAGDKLIVAYDTSGEKDVVKTASGWATADGSAIDETTMVKKDETTLGVGKGFAAGDIILFVTGYKNGDAVWSDVVLYRKAQPSMEFPDFTMPSFSFNFSMPGMGSGTSSGQTQLFDLKGDVLMTVTPQDTMTVTVAVDETDIFSLKTGMTAEITINALPDETFEGEITRIATSGTSNGGSSKFAVEITLPRQSDMLAGMSASAVIALYEKMDVLTIPAAALEEVGGKTIVYTALDKKTGEPTSPVEVTAGISDGETVEILAGLSSGDSIYYHYYDTVEESDAVETDRFQMK